MEDFEDEAEFQRELALLGPDTGDRADESLLVGSGVDPDNATRDSEGNTTGLHSGAEVPVSEHAGPLQRKTSKALSRSERGKLTWRRGMDGCLNLSESCRPRHPHCRMEG